VSANDRGDRHVNIVASLIATRRKKPGEGEDAPGQGSSGQDLPASELHRRERRKADGDE
jgi:hypothetical protein